MLIASIALGTIKILKDVFVSNCRGWYIYFLVFQLRVPKKKEKISLPEGSLTLKLPLADMIKNSFENLPFPQVKRAQPHDSLLCKVGNSA